MGNTELWINAAGNLTPVDYAAAFIEENRAFSDLFAGIDDSRLVPTCPGWSLGRLFKHVGRGDRWAAQIVRDRLDQRLDPRAVENGRPPPDPRGAVQWLHEGAQLLLDEVKLTGAETPVWTFLGPRPAAWWIRRRLHETVVHRADAAIALGQEFTLEAPVAADAISEFLERIQVQAGSDGTPLPLAERDVLHLHATDPGLGQAGEWIIGISDGRIAWSHDHDKGAVALRGSARELLAAITRRVDVTETGIDVFGDDSVWRNWLGNTPL